MTDKTTGNHNPGPSLNKESLWTKTFIIIWLFNFLICIWVFMLNAPFTFYIIELGGSEFLVGVVAACYAIAALIMRPLAGWMLDNRSRKELLIWSILLLILISLLLIFLPILGVVVILRVFSGFLFSGTSTASTTNAYDSITSSRFAEGIGFLGLGNTLAMALAPALGLFIIAEQGFNLLFTLSTVILILAVVLIKGFPFKKVIRQDIPKEKTTRFWSNLFNADALPASVVMLFTTIPYGGVSIFIALYGEIYNLGSAGLFFTLFAFGTGSARLIAGRIADKWGERPMILTGNFLLLISLALILAENSYCYYTSGLLYGIGSGVMLPAAQAMSMRVVPVEKRGSATSTYLCSYDIASGVGGILAGWLVTVFGYKPMFGSFSIFLVIAVLVYTFWASKTPSAFKVYQQNQKEIT